MTFKIIGPEPISARWYMLASLLFFVLACAAWRLLTSSMTLHMLVHIPMIVMSGVLAGRALESMAPSRRISRLLERYSQYNEHGLPGLLLAGFVGAWWMIPKALDDVLLSAPLHFLKFVVLFATGMLLRDAWQRANRVIKLFFLGNFSWMTAIVGLLYQEHPARLCNFYLLGDQEIAGAGLVILSIVLPLGWLLAELGPVLRYLRQ